VTPKQIERAKKKIGNIKRTLAAEKRKFGCYDDSRGLRYLPTTFFIQLGDYSGGQTYLKWFDKNFPDNSGFLSFYSSVQLFFSRAAKLKKLSKRHFKHFAQIPTGSTNILVDL
jgi:hypothetical protein